MLLVNQYKIGYQSYHGVETHGEVKARDRFERIRLANEVGLYLYQRSLRFVRM
jgi:hypothetical protein